jgi:hypothetical protein
LKDTFMKNLALTCQILHEYVQDDSCVENERYTQWRGPSL